RVGFPQHRDQGDACDAPRLERQAERPLERGQLAVDRPVRCFFLLPMDDVLSDARLVYSSRLRLLAEEVREVAHRVLDPRERPSAVHRVVVQEASEDLAGRRVVDLRSYRPSLLSITEALAEDTLGFRPTGGASAFSDLLTADPVSQVPVGRHA